MSSHDAPYRLALPSGGVVVVAPLRTLQQLNISTDQTHTKRMRETLTWRALICEELNTPNLEFRYDDVGAPYIVGSPLHIGVSHSQRLVAVIISPNKCAIDIEAQNRNFNAIRSRYISTTEAEIKAPHIESIIWCAKETLYKYSARKGLDLIEDIKIHYLNENIMGGSITPHTTVLELNIQSLDNHSLVYLG